ncbi:ABC transporter permease [Paenibacillus sp. YN15]|uniref:ABC transporter permease n=1 Tax=Paenibacillus sp. YN15 TaxID=1742774 RepID=UPI000DCCD92C|nr:ABC transporter permease [Paenibacillus sp. YN15]RAU91999.1 ABC transporter permease [Paenibacillus sp. YN15]
MNNGFLTVMGFTIRNKFRSKSFLVTSAILALLVIVGSNLPYIISKFQSDKPTEIGMVAGDLATRLGEYYETQEKPEVILRQYPDQGSAAANDAAMKERISSGEIKGYLELGAANGASSFPKVTYKSKATIDFGFTNKLRSGLEYVKNQEVAKGLPAETLQKLMTPVAIDNVQISTTDGGAGSVGQEGKTAQEVQIATGMVYILVIVLFMGVMITGQLIATEITAEKSSRVMEVLITSVSPLKQMFGKIVGMLVVGLSQILLIAAVALINLTLPHNIDTLKNLNIDLGDIDPLLIVFAVIFYLLGYFLYSTLYAAVGSIVSRTEELGQAVMPLTLFSLAGFYLAIFGLTTPNATYVVVSSFIPFFSPFLMFMRIGLTDPAWWEVALSLLILCGTIFGLGWLSAKIYRTGVLMYGKRPTLKELSKAMKAYKV